MNQKIVSWFCRMGKLNDPWGDGTVTGPEFNGYKLSARCQSNGWAGNLGSTYILEATGVNFGRLATNTNGFIRWHGDQTQTKKGRRTYTVPSDEFLKEAKTEVYHASVHLVRSCFQGWRPEDLPFSARHWDNKMDEFLHLSPGWPGFWSREARWGENVALETGIDALLPDTGWRFNNYENRPDMLAVGHACSLITEHCFRFNQHLVDCEWCGSDTSGLKNGGIGNCDDIPLDDTLTLVPSSAE